MASASDHRAHEALHPADSLILLPQRLPAAAETSIGPAHYPAECTQSDAFLQPSLRARKGRAQLSFVPYQAARVPVPAEAKSTALSEEIIRCGTQSYPLCCKSPTLSAAISRAADGR